MNYRNLAAILKKSCIQIIIMLPLFCQLVLILAGCSVPTDEVVELKRFSLDRMDGILTRAGVEIDKQITVKGSSSLRITTAAPKTIRLLEAGDINIENALLIAKAETRSNEKDLKIRLKFTYHLPGENDFITKGGYTPLKINNEWQTVKTGISLFKGENPDRIRLDMAIEEKGTVWIDDIRLIKRSLPYCETGC